MLLNSTFASTSRSQEFLTVLDWSERSVLVRESTRLQYVIQQHSSFHKVENLMRKNMVFSVKAQCQWINLSLLEYIPRDTYVYADRHIEFCIIYKIPIVTKINMLFHAVIIFISRHFVSHRDGDVGHSRLHFPIWKNLFLCRHEKLDPVGHEASLGHDLITVVVCLTLLTYLYLSL